MTVDQILEAVRNHGFERLTAAARLDAVNDAYFDACSRQPWPFLDKTSTVTSTGTNGQTVTVSDLRQVRSVVDTLGKVPLQFTDAQEQIDTWEAPGNVNGTPEFYRVTGNVITVFPSPGAARDFQVYYTQRPAALSAGGSEASILLPLQHHRLLVVGAVARLFELVRKPAKAEPRFAEFERRIEAITPSQMVREITKGDLFDTVNPKDMKGA